MCLSLLNHARRPETQFQWHSCNLYVTESLLKGTFHPTFLLYIHHRDVFQLPPEQSIHLISFTLGSKVPIRYKHTAFSSARLPPWTELQKVVDEISPYEMGQPSKTLAHHQLSSFKQTWLYNMPSSAAVKSCVAVAIPVSSRCCLPFLSDGDARNSLTTSRYRSSHQIRKNSFIT